MIIIQNPLIEIRRKVYLKYLSVDIWMVNRKFVLSEAKSFYLSKEYDDFEGMYICARLINEQWLRTMKEECPILTSWFIARHKKILKDPIEGFKSGKYDR